MDKDKKEGKKVKALKAAFPNTLPVLAGFGFLGLSYGIYMNASGFSFLYPMLMGLTIFGGSLEFVAVSMLLSTFAPWQTLLVTLMIQLRHLFYGISMLEKYKGLGWKKFYLIFGLCDETFSINYSAEVPDGVDKGWFMFFVTMFNQIYWVTAATIGGIAGSFIPFSTEGIEFVMTAMFVAIFIDRLKKEKQYITAVIGISATAACLFIFGSESFMIPAMLCILFMITVLRKPIEGRIDK